MQQKRLDWEHRKLDPGQKDQAEETVRVHSVQQAVEAGLAEQWTEDGVNQAEEAGLREQERQQMSLSIEQL